MKIVMISDTHGKEKKLKIPDGDMLIHAGDFQTYKDNTEIFLKWFSEQNHKYKILIAGNHDITFSKMGSIEAEKLCEKYNIIYLQDSETIIEGLKIYGSPWSNEFGDWPFMLSDEQLSLKWDKIPLDTDILITHGPKKGIGDKVMMSYDGNGNHVGSFTLAKKIKRLKKLKLHVFGHIHLNTGIYRMDGYKSVNAAMIFEYYQKNNGVKDPLSVEIIK